MSRQSDIPAREFVFKRVDGLDIALDVYLPSVATKEDPAGVMVWFHGGGLFQGNRQGESETHKYCVMH
jgi:acetyl esterase/lipase